MAAASADSRSPAALKRQKKNENKKAKAAAAKAQAAADAKAAARAAKGAQKGATPKGGGKGAKGGKGTKGGPPAGAPPLPQGILRVTPDTNEPICYAWCQSRACKTNPCPFKHVCWWCGGNHKPERCTA